MHKNAIALIIVILCHSELDMKISDTGIEPMESDNYRGISKNNRDANDVLAVM